MNSNHCSLLNSFFLKNILCVYVKILSNIHKDTGNSHKAITKILELSVFFFSILLYIDNLSILSRSLSLLRYFKENP